MTPHTKINPRSAAVTLWVMLGVSGTVAISIAAIAVIGAGYLANVPSVLLGSIVDLIISGGAFADTWPLFMLIVACLLGRVILVVIQKYLVERTAVRVQKGVLLDGVSKVLKLRVDALQHIRAAETAERLAKRTRGTVELLKLICLQALPKLALALPALALTFTQSLVAGGILLAVLALSAAVTAAQIASQKGIRIALIDKGAGLTGRIAELLSHLDFVRALGMSPRVQRQMEDWAEDIRRIEFLHHKWMMSFDAIKGFIEDGGLVAIILIGIIQTASGDMTAGTILALAILYKSAAIPLQELHRIVDELYEALLHINAAAPILKIDDDPGILGTEEPRLCERGPIVVAKNLSVTREAPDNKSKVVLNNVSFTINADEVVGIAGPSGSGKSTLVRAILGLLPDYEGQLAVFGSEIRTLSKEQLSDWLAYAPQKPYVRHADVRGNLIEGVVRMGVIDDAKLRAAMRRARCRLLLDHVLTEGGENINAGERQHLSFARIFAKTSAKLVVLDEATSSLDASSQARVLEELRKHAQGRALVMVAHRLDTLRWADRVLVMDDGEIVQSGPYGELETAPGLFSQLLSEQSEGKVLAA
jgi:ATP-binding cassette subfamily B protein